MTKIKDEQFLEKLKTVEPGISIIRQSEKDYAAERKTLADDNLAIEAEWIKTHAAQEKQIVARTAACQRLWAAWQSELHALNVDRFEQNMTDSERTRRVNANEQKLRETRSPLLAEFSSWISDEWELASKKQSFRHEYKDDRIKGRIYSGTVNNFASIRARVDALRAARDEIILLSLDPDQSNMAVRIDAIKVALPKVEDI